MGKVFIYGVIGREVNAKETIAEIEAITDNLEVHINSPGGSVYEGFAIYNALQRKKEILSTYIDGLAYSAASWMAISAKPENRYMSKASQFGIHQAVNFQGGNKQDLESQIETLNKLDAIQVDIYTGNTNISESRILELMKAGQPLSISEAEEFGFKEYQSEKIAALFNINNMDFNENLKAFGDMLKGKKNEVQESISEKVKKETDEAIKNADSVKAAFTAEFMPRAEHEEFKQGIEGFVKAMMEHIEKQPSKDEIEKWIEAKANEKVIQFIAEYKSKGSVPVAEETSFNEEAVKNYNPLTLPKNVNFNKIFNKETVK